MLPGLTATMGIALLTGLTFQWESSNAIVILIAIYVGAIYGGSRSAILVNIPGTPANAAACIDGHPLALQGKAGEAIGIATTSSFLGSTIALFFMAFFTPYLGQIALRFQSFEFFWLTLVRCLDLRQPDGTGRSAQGMDLRLSGTVSGDDRDGGHPGLSPLCLWKGRSVRRHFDDTGAGGRLRDDRGYSDHGRGPASRKNLQIRRVLPRIRDLLNNWKNIIRSGLIGVFVGAVPGVGENIASFVAYDFARRASKTPEKFGKGSIEGLTAAETGDNACVGGAIIPVLVLAVPGSPPAAVLLAAMWLHGMRPGPLLVIEAPNYIYEVSAMFLLASVAMLILGLSMVRVVVKVLHVPTSILMPIILVLCAVGSFAISGRVFDILIMLLFGVIGYPLRKMKYPDAPLILGLILGPMLDENLRRGLILNEGSLVPFFTRPISIILIIFILMTLFSRSQILKQAPGRVKNLIFSWFRKPT
jgi:putative tricarboxylic transport membrane protein